MAISVLTDKPEQIAKLENDGWTCSGGPSTKFQRDNACREAGMTLVREACDGKSSTFTRIYPVCNYKDPEVNGYYCAKLQDPEGFKKSIVCKPVDASKVVKLEYGEVHNTNETSKELTRDEKIALTKKVILSREVIDAKKGFEGNDELNDKAINRVFELIKGGETDPEFIKAEVLSVIEEFKLDQEMNELNDKAKDLLNGNPSDPEEFHKTQLEKLKNEL